MIYNKPRQLVKTDNDYLQEEIPLITFIFDIDDTLYNQVTPFEDAYRFLLGDRDYKVDIVELFVCFRKRSDEVYEQSMRGEMSMKDMQIYRMKKAFEDLNISISEEEAWTLQQIYAKNQKEIKLPETIKEMLDACKGKARLGVVTNGPAEHQMGKALALGLTKWIPEDFIIISGAVGVAKPERGIFEAALEKMRPDGEVYYIGDSFVNDVQGAKGAGLKTIWLNRRNHRVPDGAQLPDYIVKTEEELKHLLEEMIA